MASYLPATGYWRTTPHHTVLWAALGVLDRIERQVPDARALRPYQARLRRLIARVVTPAVLARLWRTIAKATPATDLNDDDPIVQEAVAAIVAALFAEIRDLRAAALAAVEARFGRAVPAELRERAIAEAFDLVRGIPETLRDELRRLLRETMAEQRTPADFARAIRQRWASIARQRAAVIAQTEWARVAGRATLDLYRLQGTRRKVWYTVGDARVCPVCQSNAAIGPIPIDERFPGGVETTPQHPTCRCAVAGAL